MHKPLPVDFIQDKGMLIFRFRSKEYAHRFAKLNSVAVDD